MRAYVRQQLEWGRFWKLLEFGDKVEKLLEVRSNLIYAGPHGGIRSFGDVEGYRRLDTGT